MKEEAYRALVDDGERSTSVMDVDVVPENTYLCVHADNELSYETNRGCTQEGMSRIYFWDPWRRVSVEHRALLWSGRATLKLGTPQTRIFAVQVSSEGCCCSLVQYFIQQLLLGLVCLQPAPSSIAGILYCIQKPPVALFFSSHLQITLCYNNTLYLQLLLFKWHTAVFCV